MTAAFEIAKHSAILSQDIFLSSLSTCQPAYSSFALEISAAPHLVRM
jgi:hypothetical protein